jgi:hypothetical protein
VNISRHRIRKPARFGEQENSAAKTLRRGEELACSEAIKEKSVAQRIIWPRPYGANERYHHVQVHELSLKAKASTGESVFFVAHGKTI